MHPSTTAQQQNPPVPAENPIRGIERIVTWIGSPASLALHTLAFVCFFSVSIFKWVAWDLMLLVLTTLVSLEAIYLAIFIQMTVNRQSQSLKEVEEEVGDIQDNIEELGENVEELGENVEDLKEDVEDIQEDIGEIGEDEEEESRDRKQAEMIEALTKDVRAILKSLESLKAR
jgi:uncharacterized membrane protein